MDETATRQIDKETELSYLALVPRSRGKVMNNHILDLPEEEVKWGYAVLLGLIQSEYKICDKKLESLTAEATHKTINLRGHLPLFSSESNRG